MTFDKKTTKTKTISPKALREAEIRAEKENIHISKAIMGSTSTDSGELEILTRRSVMFLVPKRPINSHKGSFGKLLIIAGSDRFPGAAQIAAIAALRSGAGLVKVISTVNACHALSVNAKEATLFPCPADENGFISGSDTVLKSINGQIGWADAVLIGCGLGVTDGTMSILETVIENANCPIIIDADGINLVSRRIELLRKAKEEVILTPHPAELARLGGISLKEAIENRFETAKRISGDYGAIVVAKGCATIAVSKYGHKLLTFGNDGLAKGGSGDLQAGLTASFAAQTMVSPWESAILGSGILGIACERVSKRLSKRGMLASDILDCLPKLFK